MAELAYVALGSNVGDRRAYLAAARTSLASLTSCRLLAASRIEETAPFGSVSQGPYLNQMLALESTRTPLELLDEMKVIERRLGRIRDRRWGPRTVDLDLVSYGSYAIDSDTLILPHPGLASRAFWQREAAELSAILAHPA